MGYAQDWEGTLADPKMKLGTEIAMQYNGDGMLLDGETIKDGMPKFDALEMAKGNTEFNLTKSMKLPDDGFDLGGLFKADKIGGTLSGIGEIAKAGAMVYDAYNKKKYQDKVFGMEEKRVARETARQDKQQANYDKVFG